jgi:hypothetical protein
MPSIITRYEPRHAVPAEPRQPRVRLSIRPPRGWWVYLAIVFIGISIAIIAPRWHATPFTDTYVPPPPPHTITHPLWEARPSASPSPSPRVYTVQAGQSLGQVAQEACPGVPVSQAVSALSKANNLASPDLIIPGEKLILKC